MILYLFDSSILVVEEPNDRIEATLQKLQEKFTVYQPGYRFSAAYRKGHWDGKTFIGEALLTKDGSAALKFGRGLRREIYQELKKLTDGAFDLIDRRTPRLLLDPDLYDDEVLRWYQKEAIVTAVERLSGLIVLPTGAGKTEVATNLTAYTGNPRTLFLVNSKDLLQQTIDRYVKYNVPARLFDISDESDTVVEVSTIQKVYYYHKKYADEMKPIYDRYDCVIVDEAHHAKSASYQNVLSAIKTPHIYGLTATPQETTKYEQLSLFLNIGPIVYEKTLAELSKGDVKILVSGEVEIRDFLIDEIEGAANYSEHYYKGLVLNDRRNQLAVDWVLEDFEENFTLVFVSRKEHGERIQELSNGQIPFISGETADRDEWIEKLRSGKLHALVTTVMKEGVDIPRITRVVNLEGGLSPRPVIQKAGRATRRFEGKSSFTILDFLDRGDRIFENHAKARLKQYHALGFEVRRKAL